MDVLVDAVPALKLDVPATVNVEVNVVAAAVRLESVLAPVTASEEDRVAAPTFMRICKVNNNSRITRVSSY